MRPDLYTLRSGPGRLSVMARPRGGDWLADEMTALKTAGVDVLVCALTTTELAELDLDEEGQAADEAGLRFIRLPIADRGVPDHQTAKPTLEALAEQLLSGAHVVAHCRFGIGRASLIAASRLVLNGETLDDAWRRIEALRDIQVPDTPEQRDWPAALRQ